MTGSARGSVTVILADPEEEASAPYDIRSRRAFEMDGRRMLGLPTSLTLQETIERHPESYITWVAWHALHRSGAFKGDYAAFAERAVSISVDAAEGLPDPTRTAQ